MGNRFLDLVGKLLRPFSWLEPQAQKRGYPRWRDGVLGTALLLLGAAAALLIVEPWRVAAPPVPAVEIGSSEIATGEARPESLLKIVREQLQSPVTLAHSDFSRKLTWAELGADVDLEALSRILVELAREDSPEARYFQEQVTDQPMPRIPMPIQINVETAVEALVSLKETIDRLPKSARFNAAQNTITAEAPGRSLDVYATLVRLDAALANQEQQVALAVEEIKPAVTQNDLEGIKVEAVAGFYETPYSRMRKNKDRTHNVKLGASILDGQVIMPGQIFSFNETLGDRIQARGFRYAPVIAGGVLVEGMGGGTCQLASTLYAASFFSGLIVLERQPHSRPSSYIKLGLDATVSYPDLDLKLKNPFEFPVVIHFTAADGILRAELRGKERPYTVTLLRKVIGTRPYPVRTIDDSKLPRSTEVVTQIGIPGYTVRRFQIIERDKVAYRHQTVDKYPPTAEFLHRGTADPTTYERPRDAPKADPHKPYRASTYLRMAQGPEGLWSESSHE